MQENELETPVTLPPDKNGELIRHLRRIAEIGEGWGSEEDIQAICGEAAAALSTPSATRTKDELAEACAGLVNYWTRNLRNFQWEKADEHVKRINIALGEYVHGEIKP